MPRMEFEPTIPVFEPAKTFHALGHEATVIGNAILKAIILINTSECIRSWPEFFLN
jgi:hypothetical protein